MATTSFANRSSLPGSTMLRPARAHRARFQMATALTALLVAATPAAAPAGTPASEPKLAKGQFLIAQRSLHDPNFAETVVLLLDYSPDGALGVVVNRPSAVQLSQLWPELEKLAQRPDTLHTGGPVATGQILMLLRDAEVPEDAQHVFGDVSTSASRELLEQLIGDGIPRDRLRIYAGYAGWAPGQLDHEVERGDWIVWPADAGSVFSEAPHEVWHELVRHGSAQLARVGAAA